MTPIASAVNRISLMLPISRRTIEFVQLNLARLKQMHPRLPASTAAEYTNRAAVALQRQQHEPVCNLFVTFHDGSVGFTVELDWPAASSTTARQLDRHRVTEDGAEAVALGFVHEHRRWVVLRRLQRGEFADWLMEDTGRRLVALEVSGIDGQPDPGRVAEKVQQVANAIVTEHGCACVVAFGPPATSVADV
ncbi:MAG: hypothetical protein ACRD12_17760 [Acidimicrobiales bacterium]